MGIYDNSTIGEVIPIIEESATRSSNLEINFLPQHSSQYFHKLLVNFISVAELVHNTYDLGISPIRMDYEAVLTSSSSFSYVEINLNFEVDSIDTSLVLSTEDNGILATETDIFTRPEIAPFISEIPYMAIDFTGTGTNPLQLIYDWFRVFHKISLSERKEYPTNEAGFNFIISHRAATVNCRIILVVRFRGSRWPFFENIALRYE